MKKYLSVFYLIARESLYKLLGLFVFGGVMQAIVVIYEISQNGENGLFKVFDESELHIAFMLFFILTSVLLCKTGMRFSSDISYTLRRLRIKETDVFVVQCVYNAIILFMGLLLEVILMFALAVFANNKIAEPFATSQSVYLLLFSDRFLINLFCGSDILRIVRNILLCISSAVNYATLSYLIRYQHIWWPALVFCVYFYFSFMFSDLLFDGEKLIVLDDYNDFYSDTGIERNCVLRVYILESDGVKYYCKWYGSLGGENRQIFNYTFFRYSQINTLS